MAARGATILLTSMLAFVPLAPPQAAYAQQEPVVEVSGSDRAKIDAAMERLAKSGLPLLEMGIDPPTGSLGIMIDIDRAGPDT